MTLRLATPPPTPATRLASLLRANHADGTDVATRAACETPTDDLQRRAGYRQAGLVEQADGYWCDPQWDRHGLVWWYPHLVELVSVRSTKGRNGAGGGIGVPIDLTALDFVADRYWIREEAPTEVTEDDPDSYRAGFVPTVIALEQSTRIALRLGSRPRPRAEGYEGVGFDARVPAAIEAIATQAEQLVDVAPQLASTVRSEAARLIGRAKLLVLGSPFEATINECMHCAEDTVIADEDRAFCRNPDCRTDTGARHCWRLTEVVDVMSGDTRLQWLEVDEPDVRGRGQLSEEQLSRWTAAL